MQIFLCMDDHFSGRSIQISMQNPDYIAQKNGWFIPNSMVHEIFLHGCQFFFAWLPILLGRSKWTSMQNLEFVAQKMAELKLIPWSIEFSCMDFHADFSLHGCPLFWMVHTNFHAKSWLSSSKNGLVIANWMVHGIFVHGFHANFSLHGCPFWQDGPYELPCKILSL